LAKAGALHRPTALAAAVVDLRGDVKIMREYRAHLVPVLAGQAGGLSAR
jgi:hypothetical protein